MRKQASQLLLFVLVAVTTLAGCAQPTTEGDATQPRPAGPAIPPANLTVAWGALDSAVIRPGAGLGDADGAYCTLNFLFTDDNGSAYVGTAGHCTEKVGERVSIAQGETFGTVVFDSDVTTGADPAVDFSLILIDRDQIPQAHPRMLGYEGPSSTIAAGEASPGDEVAIYGYGVVLGQDERTRPRFGVLVEEDGKLYRADMPAVNGDSGSPIIHVDSGKAFGIISHYGINAVPPSTDEGPILPFILDELAKANHPVTLATA